MANQTDETEVETEDRSDIEHRTSPELRERDYETAPDPVPTDEAESLDEVHATAAYNRAVMGPAANDPTVPTPGTDIDVEPGPGPEDNVKLDNATNGAMSAAAETGTAWPEPRDSEEFANRGELERRKNENLGIKTTFDLNAPGEQPGAGEFGTTSEAGTELVDDDEEIEQVESDYDPSEYTVADVNDYIAEHPEEADAIYAAEAAGKNRSGIVG